MLHSELEILIDWRTKTSDAFSFGDTDVELNNTSRMVDCNVLTGSVAYCLKSPTDTMLYFTDVLLLYTYFAFLTFSSAAVCQQKQLQKQLSAEL